MQFKVIFITAIFLVVCTAVEDSTTVTDESAESSVVTINQGQLQGLTYKSRKGNTYHGFLGVPYGKADTRFGAPQDPDSWKGVRSAKKLAPHCFQFCLIQQRLVGVEDCLTLNLYTTKLNGNAPVIVHIHGGGFQFGTGNFHEAKYFMDEDVVLVTIQYRLGALGFLNTEDDTVPGNNGLRDQSKALSWIQKNIVNFGGDPQRVTIFGFSAGGASVHYHMLSPMSKGLFSRAISQSGTALNPWAFQKNPRKYALLLAENVGCTRDINEEMVECLRGKSLSEIVNGQLKISKFPHEFDVISMQFCPSMEQGQSENKFLSNTPYKLMESNQIANPVPWVAGLNRDEGAFYIASIVENDKSLKLINSDWYKMLPNILYFENSASSNSHHRISEEVYKFYFNDEKITPDSHLELGRVYGDRFFVTGITRAIKMHAKQSNFPVYAYHFSHEGDRSITQDMLYAKKSYGVSHAEDLKYLFNRTYGASEFNLETEEGKFSEKLVKLYVSIAKDGKPTSTWGLAWEPLRVDEKKDEITWYDINKDTSVLTEDVFKKRTDFWESLPLKELEKEDFPDDKDEL